jgi:hypothetical protein
MNEMAPGTCSPAVRGVRHQQAISSGDLPRRLSVELAVVVIFMAIVLIALGLVAFARHESRLVPRASLTSSLSGLRRSSRVVITAASGECPCGGLIIESGRVSPRLGPLYTCASCHRNWTASGRRVIRRPAGVGRRRQPRP